ncbi:glycosyltransferase [Roseovarius confluentis]|uniref:glycosyltransferase n=1 Tax=Roseovarius confluentis TaxID=1852027 RepID=UPI000CDD5625|nr:glycosyltransferase family 2 protein [Roseovarius confluentis]
MDPDDSTRNEAKPSIKSQFLDKVDAHLPSRSLTQDMRSPAADEPSSQRLLNRIGLISGKTVAATLGKYADVSPISPDQKDEFIDWQAMDFLLIVAQVLPFDEPWRRCFLNIEDEGFLLSRLLRRAKAHRVPSVLWVEEESEAIGMFAHLFDKVDHLMLPEGAEHGKSERVSTLPVGVDVKSFNPLLPKAHMRRSRARFIGFLIDGAHEIGIKYGPERAYEAFKPFFEYNWWLTDSSNDLRNGDHKIHAAMRRRFLGSMRDSALSKPLQLASGYFLPEALVSGRKRHAQRLYLSAGACKTCVVTDDPSFKQDYISYTGDTESLEAFRDWVLNDHIGREAVQHLAWRQTLTHHSYFEVLKLTLSIVGIQARFSQPENPHVNVVVPTIRPDLIPFILKNVERQKHDNLSLSIVINGAEVPADIRRLVDAHPFASLYSMPGYKSIGYCINYGIEQSASDYWAKFDDDDIYGPDYLSDMLLQRKYVDFDITGKAAIFTYLEEFDRLHIRRLWTRDTLEPFIGGGTILARTGTNMFPEDVRGYADTLYLTEAEERGYRILSSDPFNFAQVRRADPSSHTWTAGAHQLNLKGPQRSGLNLSGVIL